MKNPFTQFALIIFAFIALTFLMAYVKPTADEPKQYIILLETGMKAQEKLTEAVNQKLAEGWRPQGGSSVVGTNVMAQAMVK